MSVDEALAGTRQAMPRVSPAWLDVRRAADAGARAPDLPTLAQRLPSGRSGRAIWAWARLLGGAGILVVLVWWVGTGPFLDGLRAVSAPGLVVAFSIAMVTTACCAWRWSLIARGLGVRLPVREAVAAYYRAQFLNASLPGGVIGDVHRAVRHGLDIGDVGLGVRAVVLDRVSGQTVQIVLSIAVLSVFPSPVRRYMPVVMIVAIAIGLAGLLLARTARGRSSRWARAVRRVGTEVRAGLGTRRAWLGIVVASTVVMAGHLAMFVLAARTAGSAAPLSRLLPLTLLALLAMILPLNVAGWGPREGVAAWVFGAAGLAAAEGVATAVTYGVFVLVGSLPGAGVLLVRWLRRNQGGAGRRDPAQAPVPAFGQAGVRG